MISTGHLWAHWCCLRSAAVPQREAGTSPENPGCQVSEVLPVGDPTSRERLHTEFGMLR
jgi:hypothetical protein